MRLLSELSFLGLKTKSPRQVVSDKWADRDKINESDVNLFCWKRSMEAEVSDFLVKVIDRQPKPIQFHSNLEELGDNIELAKQKWTWSDLEPLDLFWEDLKMLISDFLTFSEHKSGTIHLKVIDNNACTKFHTDGYTLRLFTTYYGEGTEWLPEKAVNRSGLGKTNEQIVKDPSQIQQMEAFEVGILKGEVPNSHNRTKGIVHRSPEIVGTGEKRIILRIDI